MLDTRYKGNLLLLAEQGFNIKHFYKHISTSNSYLHVYLKLLNEAMNETNPMLQYYRFWNIAEGIASKKQYHSRKMKKWDGSSVIGKGKDVLIGETALNNVFELYRENFGSISDKDFAAGLEKISKPKEFLSVCYQRRNCCAHLGTCFSADGKICDKNDKVKKLCKESFIVNKEEALGFQDKILRKLQDTVFRIVLNELITESGEVKKETDLVYSTGLNLNGQWGYLTFNVKAGFAIDRDGDITIYYGADSGLAAPSHSLSLTNYHSLYLAPESTDILGEGAQIGASGNLPGTPFVAGGEFNVLGNPNDGNSYYGGTVYSGIGTPGFTPYCTQGYNHEIKTFNILDIFKRS